MTSIEGKNIFITGGAGFIGSYLVEELLQLNPKRIFILDNLIRGSLANMQQFIHDARVEFVEGDIRQQTLVNRIMKESDYLFHMAALRINACAANPQEGFDVMLKGTFDVLESARQHQIKKVVYSSSASVYGLAQHFPTPETDNPYNNQTFYGGAKLWGEQLLRSYAFMFNMKYVALRYFNVYGPRMDTDGKYTEVMIRWLDCIRDGRAPLIFGNGSTSMDFVYVQDVAKANVAALLADVTDEAFNIGNSVETSLLELLRLLLQVNQSSLKPEFKPDNTINPVPRRLADVEQAKQRLGFSPTIDLSTGLEKLSAWYFELQKAKSNT